MDRTWLAAFWNIVGSPMDRKAVFWSIVGSVIATVTGVSYRCLVDYIKSRRGVLTGSWIQRIPAQKGQPAKMDRVNCRHIGSCFTGDIQRVEPSEQKHKQWQFSGQLRGSLVFMTFWTTDLARNPGSYGTIQLNMIDDAHLWGFYVKRVVASNVDRDKWQFTEGFEQFEIDWMRPDS
jgi:hypothetical protein